MKVRRNGSNYKLVRRYRKGRVFWHGDVFYAPDWVARNLDGRRPIIVRDGMLSLTERGMRRKILRALRREREEQGHLEWTFAGRHRVSA